MEQMTDGEGVHRMTLLRETLIKAKAFIAECWDYHYYSAPENCSHCALLVNILDTLEATGDDTGKETDWERLHLSSLSRKKS